MLLFEQQQFEFLLQTAVERFVQRSEQRFRGAEGALRQWKLEPQQLSAWLVGFCDAVFEDFLLNNIDGACFVLRAMSEHSLRDEDDALVDELPHPTSVKAHLIALAKRLFCRLLYRKSIEALELHTNYQAFQIEG